jgi:hypothetical protein
MKKLLPEINVGHTRGQVFCTAHVFTPKGTIFLVGSWDLITEHLKNEPTCHGVVGRYSKHWQQGDKKRVDSHIDLFGRRSGFKGEIYLIRLSAKEADHHHTIFKQLVTQRLISKRMRYYLVSRDFSECTIENRVPKDMIIGHWRSMPSCYLRELAELEKQSERN